MATAVSNPISVFHKQQRLLDLDKVSIYFTGFTRSIYSYVLDNVSKQKGRKDTSCTGLGWIASVTMTMTMTAHCPLARLQVSSSSASIQKVELKIKIKQHTLSKLLDTQPHDTTGSTQLQLLSYYCLRYSPSRLIAITIRNSLYCTTTITPQRHFSWPPHSESLNSIW